MRWQILLQPIKTSASLGNSLHFFFAASVLVLQFSPWSMRTPRSSHSVTSCPVADTSCVGVLFLLKSITIFLQDSWWLLCCILRFSFLSLMPSIMFNPWTLHVAEVQAYRTSPTETVSCFFSLNLWTDKTWLPHLLHISCWTVLGLCRITGLLFSKCKMMLQDTV